MGGLKNNCSEVIQGGSCKGRERPPGPWPASLRQHPRSGKPWAAVSEMPPVNSIIRRYRPWAAGISKSNKSVLLNRRRALKSEGTGNCS